LVLRNTTCQDTNELINKKALGRSTNFLKLKKK
jgi:hypothetical protein